jgi:hypothetical protein
VPAPFGTNIGGPNPLFAGFNPAVRDDPHPPRISPTDIANADIANAYPPTDIPNGHPKRIPPTNARTARQVTYDSWLTIGPTDNSMAGAISSIGIVWGSWTADDGVQVDNGALFYMSPEEGPTDREVVVAQLTVPTGSLATAGAVVMNAQGRSSGEAADWRQTGITFR